MNSTIVLARLVDARNEGGRAHAITRAQALVAEHFPNQTFAVETHVNRVLNALDRGDRTAAETAINEALATLNRPEPTPVVATDAAVAEDTTNHEARIAALEQIARNNGYSEYVITEATFEVRLSNLERAARRANLR